MTQNLLATPPESPLGKSPQPGISPTLCASDTSTAIEECEEFDLALLQAKSHFRRNVDKVVSLNASVDEFKSKYSAKDAQCTHLENENQGHVKLIKSLMEERNKFETCANRSAEEHAVALQRVEEWKVKCTKSEKELQSLEVKSKHDLENLTSRLMSAESDLSASQARGRCFENQVQDEVKAREVCRNQLQKAETELSESKAEQEALRNRILGYEAELERQKGTNESQKRTIEKLNQIIRRRYRYSVRESVNKIKQQLENLEKYETEDDEVVSAALGESHLIVPDSVATLYSPQHVVQPCQRDLGIVDKVTMTSDGIEVDHRNTTEEPEDEMNCPILVPEIPTAPAAAKSTVNIIINRQQGSITRQEDASNIADNNNDNSNGNGNGNNKSPRKRKRTNQRVIV